jgi:hypothetical protein
MGKAAKEMLLTAGIPAKLGLAPIAPVFLEASLSA